MSKKIQFFIECDGCGLLNEIPFQGQSSEELEELLKDEISGHINCWYEVVDKNDE